MEQHVLLIEKQEKSLEATQSEAELRVQGVSESQLTQLRGELQEQQVQTKRTRGKPAPAETLGKNRATRSLEQAVCRRR